MNVEEGTGFGGWMVWIEDGGWWISGQENQASRPKVLSSGATKAGSSDQ